MKLGDGPSDGNWSVFAEKVVDERDAARARIAALEAQLREREEVAAELRRNLEISNTLLDAETDVHRQIVAYKAAAESAESALAAARAENARLREAALGEREEYNVMLHRCESELHALRARPDDGRVRPRGCLLQPSNGACVNRRMVCDKDETVCKWLAAADVEVK